MNLLNDLIVNWCSHGESTAREVGVKVLPIHEIDTRWRVTVTRQQVVNVVLTTVPETTYQTISWKEGLLEKKTGRKGKQKLPWWPGHYLRDEKMFLKF